MTTQPLSPSPTADLPPSFAGRIGFARRDITPPVGICSRNWGAAPHDTAQKIHQPMNTTAMWVDLPAGPVALVSADLCWWRTAQDEWAMRSAVLAATGLSTDRLILHLTHTHAAAAISLSMVDYPGGHLIPAYIQQCQSAISQAILAARDTAVPARMEAFTTHCGMAACREQLHAEYGPLVGYAPEKQPDGTVLIARVAAESDGSPLGVIVNYACHPTTLGVLNVSASPDYVGAMRDVIEPWFGGPVLFLQGASGDQAPRHQYVADPRIAEANGQSLGYSVIAELAYQPATGQAMRFQKPLSSGANLGIWRPALYDSPTGADIKVAAFTHPAKACPSFAELDRRTAETTDRAEQERLRRTRVGKQSIPENGQIELQVNVWRLGGLVFVAVPGEAHTPYQQALRAAAPEHGVFVANHYVGLPCLFYQRTRDSRSRDNDNTLDIQLVYSRDGLVWHRARGRRPFIAPGPHGTWDCGMIHATARPPLLVDDQLYIYYDGFPWTHVPADQTGPHGQGLAILRRDGFMSIQADQVNGFFLTHPHPYNGEKLFINAHTNRGYVRAVPVDPITLDPLEGAEGSNAFDGDSTKAELTWPDGGLDKFIGQEIQLKFECKGADVYSYWFKE